MANAMTPADQAFNDWADNVPGPHGVAMRALDTQASIMMPDMRSGLAALYAPPPVQRAISGPSPQELAAYSAGLQDTQAAMTNYWRRPATTPPASRSNALDTAATMGADFLGGMADGLTGGVNMGNIRQAWSAANPGGLTPSPNQPLDPRHNKPSLS